MQWLLSGDEGLIFTRSGMVFMTRKLAGHWSHKASILLPLGLIVGWKVEHSIFCLRSGKVYPGPTKLQGNKMKMKSWTRIIIKSHGWEGWFCTFVNGICSIGDCRKFLIICCWWWRWWQCDKATASGVINHPTQSGIISGSEELQCLQEVGKARQADRGNRSISITWMM